MSDRKRKKWRNRIAAGLGIVLGIVCYVVPPDYQAACGAVAKAVGGLGGC